jgi:NAD(P)H-hydrate epimerase
MKIDPPFCLSRAEVRQLDRRAIGEFGVPGVVLMENAGRGAAELLMQLNPQRLPVTILCGPGNNGGDGFVMARHLQNHDWPVRVWLFAASTDSTASIMRLGIAPRLSPDCDVNFRIFVRSEADVDFIDAGNPNRPSNRLQQFTEKALRNAGWIVDALFGTGLDRALASPFAEAVAAVNAAAQPVLAVDIPSGLDCDTGQPLGPTIKAAHTATFVAWKKGFLAPAAAPWIGEVHVVDIGAPKRLVDQFQIPPSSH